VPASRVTASVKASAARSRAVTYGISRPEALVLGYGTPPAHAFTTAVTRLCAVLAEGP
jgi:hypothetical protein